MTVTTPDVAAWRAVADWYRAYFTGIVLSTVARRGKPRATDLVHEIFSRQRAERFLPGLRKPPGAGPHTRSMSCNAHIMCCEGIGGWPGGVGQEKRPEIGK